MMNLEKQNTQYDYFCLIEDKQQGPMDQSKLLSIITAETLIWREGIDWTIAKNVPELSNHFNSITSSDKLNHVQSNSPIDRIQNDYTIPSGVVSTPQKMFAAPFSFDGRIRRTEYAVSFVIYIIVYAILIGIVAESKSAVFAVAYIPLLWFLWAQGAKRCHDRGNSGWYQIIPFYVLWLIFAEGDNAENEYGESPK